MRAAGARHHKTATAASAQAGSATSGEREQGQNIKRSNEMAAGLRRAGRRAARSQHPQGGQQGDECMRGEQEGMRGTIYA